MARERDIVAKETYNERICFEKCENSSRASRVANTIYEQIGGRSYSMMTGSKKLGYGTTDEGDYLLASIGRGAKNRANHWLIVYDRGSDLYIVQFLRVILSRKRCGQVGVDFGVSGCFCRRFDGFV